MKTKTSELKGAQLDWAVAAALEVQFNEARVVVVRRNEATTPAWVERENSPGSAPHYHRFSPSTDWSQGGPIIERERITAYALYLTGCSESGKEVNEFREWAAHKQSGRYWVSPEMFTGQTPLIAAMRCYVASRLGDEVELPDELVTGA